MRKFPEQPLSPPLPGYSTPPLPWIKEWRCSVLMIHARNLPQLLTHVKRSCMLLHRKSGFDAETYNTSLFFYFTPRISHTCLLNWSNHTQFSSWDWELNLGFATSSPPLVSQKQLFMLCSVKLTFFTLSVRIWRSEVSFILSGIWLLKFHSMKKNKGEGAEGLLCSFVTAQC